MSILRIERNDRMGADIIKSENKLYVYKNGVFLRLLTVSQYAEKLGVTANTASRRARLGQSEAIKIGRDYYFPESEPDQTFTRKLCIKECQIATVDAKKEDTQLQAESRKILDSLGISMEQAINLFLRQIVLKRGMPFPLTLPKNKKSDPEDGFTSSVHHHKIDV